MSWVRITEIKNVPPREGRAVRIGRAEIALFNLGEQNSFLFSTSQSAQVTLTLVRPDGTTSTLLANQPVQGGVTYAINGVIGNPLGQRRLLGRSLGQRRAIEAVLQNRIDVAVRARAHDHGAGAGGFESVSSVDLLEP